MKKWNMIINVGQCENCYNCVISESDEHVGNNCPGYSAPASISSESTIQILRRSQGSAPMVETLYLPVMCNHCDDAPCINASGGVISKREDGIVIIDPVKAKGRKDLLKSCPYNAIIWNEEQQVPQTWIFDAHLLDQGWTIPRCQQACPTDVFEALKIDDVDMVNLARQEKLKVLKPELGTRPLVWYRSLSRWETCFIGGSVSADIGGLLECVNAAEISLVHDGKTIARTQSDEFGDFRFDGLPPNGGDYRIDARHTLGQASRHCSLEESAYLGEIRLIAVED